MEIHEFSLTAGQEASYPLVGSFVKVRSATGLIQVRCEQKGKEGNRLLSNAMKMSVGDKHKFTDEDGKLAQYQMVRVKDLSGAGNTVELIYGDGDHDSDSVVGSVSITNQAAATYDSQADVSLVTAASTDFAADPTVKEWILEADAANTGDLRIRDQSGTGDEGKKLKPGETIYHACKGAFRVRNNSGATQAFSVAAHKG